MKMLYKGKDIYKGMITPVRNGNSYFVEVVPTPYRSFEATINFTDMARVYDMETARCIACIPYKQEEWKVTDRDFIS